MYSGQSQESCACPFACLPNKKAPVESSRGLPALNRNRRGGGGVGAVEEIIKSARRRRLRPLSTYPPPFTNFYARCIHRANTELLAFLHPGWWKIEGRARWMELNAFGACACAYFKEGWNFVYIFFSPFLFSITTQGAWNDDTQFPFRRSGLISYLHLTDFRWTTQSTRRASFN